MKRTFHTVGYDVHTTCSDAYMLIRAYRSLGSTNYSVAWERFKIVHSLAGNKSFSTVTSNSRRRYRLEEVVERSRFRQELGDKEENW